MMRKIMFCFLFLSLLTSCSQNNLLEENIKTNEQTEECLQLKEKNEILIDEINKYKESLDGTIYLIKKGNYYNLFSKRQYADEINDEQYINKPSFVYNGIQKLRINSQSEDAVYVNNQLEINENEALNIYKLNDDNYLKQASFLWYDIEENDMILSVTSNLYTYVMDAGRPGILYDTYNFEIISGKRLNNKEFFEYLNIDLDVLCAKLNQYFSQFEFIDGIITFSTEDLFIDKTDGYMGFTFSLIDNDLIIEYSETAQNQNIMEIMGKISFPLDEIKK